MTSATSSPPPFAGRARPADARARLGQMLRLAAFDLWHERWLALCAACVVAATLAPLWTLWGLERGVVGTLIERQNGDPLMRQVLPESSGGKRFDTAWFERVRAWPEVAFAMPNTRSIANQVTLFAESAPAPLLVDFLPTAAGDPFLGGLAPPEGRGVLLSAIAAQRLAVQAGQAGQAEQAGPAAQAAQAAQASQTGQGLRMALERVRDGTTERAVVELRVLGVLPAARLDAVAALAPLPLLEAVQAWRDGYVVEGFGSAGHGPAPAIDAYPLFRLYAPSIQEVAPLAARLEAEGISTYTRGREIDATLGLQRNLRAVLGLVGAIAVAGAIVALAALQIATVRRKRREYALFKLTGHGRAWLMALPCLHALAVGLAGVALALAFYAASAAAIGRHFATHLASGESAVRLLGVDLAAGVAAAIVVCVLPALWGGWRASRVEAADELRDP